MHFHSIYIHVLYNFSLFPLSKCLHVKQASQCYEFQSFLFYRENKTSRKKLDKLQLHAYIHTHIAERGCLNCTIQSLAFKGTICNQIVPSTYVTARRWWRSCWGCLRFWWRSRCRCRGWGSTVSHWS